MTTTVRWSTGRPAALAFQTNTRYPVTADPPVLVGSRQVTLSVSGRPRLPGYAATSSGADGAACEVVGELVGELVEPVVGLLVAVPVGLPVMVGVDVVVTVGVDVTVGVEVDGVEVDGVPEYVPVVTVREAAGPVPALFTAATWRV